MRALVIAAILLPISSYAADQQSLDRYRAEMSAAGANVALALLATNCSLCSAQWFATIRDFRSKKRTV